MTGCPVLCRACLAQMFSNHVPLITTDVQGIYNPYTDIAHMAAGNHAPMTIGKP